jgi:sugar phosphate permease
VSQITHSDRIGLQAMTTRPLPALHRLAPRLFYGWLITAGAFLLSFVIVGIGFYSLTIFLDALCLDRGWSRASVSGATTLYFLTSGATGTLIGRAVDRYGPRGWIAGGALLMSVGLLAIGRVREPNDLFWVYFLMAVGFGMSSAVPTNAILARWFVTRRARAVSFSHTGVSVGGMVVVPLASMLVRRGGLELAVGCLAAIVVAVALPIVLFVLRSDPRDHGLEPDGGSEEASETSVLSDAVQLRVWRRREAVRTASFWIIALCFGAMLFTQTGFLIHQLAFLRERIGTLAPYAVSVTAFGSVVGRLAVGSFADRAPKRVVSQGIFLLQAAALLALISAEHGAVLLGCAFVFGLTMGNVYMMQSLLAADLFGRVSFGAVFGMVQLLTSMMGALGPVALGILFDQLGGYPPAIRVLLPIPIGAALLLGLLRPPAPRGARAREEVPDWTSR